MKGSVKAEVGDLVWKDGDEKIPSLRKKNRREEMVQRCGVCV